MALANSAVTMGTGRGHSFAANIPCTYFIHRMRHFFKFAALFLMIVPATAQKHPTETSQPAAQATNKAVAEDISGMYSFLKEDEFVQINLGESGISGYVSREGDTESDRGQFLDQFFSKASIQGHDVSFVTKPLHGVWFEFKGRFERGPAKSKMEDAYYLLRGTLTEFRNDPTNKATSHSREVEFKWLAQPSEN